MRNNGSIHWQKTAFIKHYMILFVVVGFAMFFTVAFLAPMRSGIRSQLFLLAWYPVALLIIFLLIRSNKFIPQKYGISREGLYLQYRKKLETFRWNEISRVYTKKTRGSTNLAIESADGKVSLISLLLKDDRERIIDHYENQRELNKPQ